MVIEDTRLTLQAVTTTAYQVPVGTVFTGELSNPDGSGTKWPNRVFLKLDCGITSLDNPDVGETWEPETDWTITNYIPRDAKVVLL